jgi:Icc-related predicted phosphoesterase
MKGKILLVIISLSSLVKEQFDSQFLTDDQIQAEDKVKKILERRLEELNSMKNQLHNKVVAYESNDDIKAIADEYKQLLARRDHINSELAQF